MAGWAAPRPARGGESSGSPSDSRVGAVSASGRASVAKSQATPPTARTRTVSRGGFGKRAAGRGSAGG